LFKVRPNFEQNGFIAKANVAKLRLHSILLKFKIKTNVISYILNLGTTHSFVIPSVVLQIGWKTTKVDETHQSAISPR
jgi:hypothetical protein